MFVPRIFFFLLFFHANNCFTVCCAHDTIHSSHLNFWGQQTNQFWLHMHIHMCTYICACVYKSGYAHSVSLSISVLFYSCITQQVTQVFCGTGPLCDLMLVLLFVIQTQLAFSMLWPLWYLITYKTATIVYSILKVGMDEENISMDMLLAAFTTSMFL